MSRIFNITLYVDNKLGTVTVTTDEEINGQRVGFGAPERITLRGLGDLTAALFRAAIEGCDNIDAKLKPERR